MSTLLSFEQFLEQNLVVPAETLENARLLQQEQFTPLPALLVRMGALSEEVLYQQMALHSGMPLVGDDDLHAAQAAFQTTVNQWGLLPHWCQAQGLILWQQEDSNIVHCAAKEVIAANVREVLRLKSPSAISLKYSLIRPSSFEAFYAALERREPKMAMSGDVMHLRELAEEGPIIELVNTVLSQAVTRRASDIHVEPGEYEFAIRLRVDGVMQDLSRFPLDKFDATVCRIKILSQLDIAERRLPQDGRMTARVNSEVFDVRVSVLPSAMGESVVMRLLRQDRKPYHLEDLGMMPDHAALFKRWIKMPNGIVLVTGPTGSGKTTTLYTALDIGNDGLNKIITVEDPVEYRLQGISQIQVNADIGFTFASALRSILRHDPDVVLIGEIRDQETASIAVQSALTGHLVFSTLHTNSAAGAVTRLVDMGIEPFLLGSSLKGVMAQRLVRCLCEECAQPAEISQETHRVLLEGVRHWKEELVEKPQLRQAVGCRACNHTGFAGRVAIYELFEVDATLQHQILSHASEAEIVRYLRENQVRSLRDDGMLKVWQGITTVEEVLSLAGA
ncbi:Flp pilus assembly complex ATPase component TadA [Undibacterium sp. FT79W]|uniref:GspE/PulE family protein n=1 Tax=Undibacterium sp. FT79W TaxID=2762296 RepID=UPI00164A58AD|nr:GspE/PulE family protein [Undibacterium sp. FT79W]MBC3877789.1 Flp pilus assembly complex ATPase component TadA [Undibacterium sp. FT79W]